MKKTLFAAGMALIALGAGAETLTPAEAVARLRETGAHRLAAKVSADIKPAYTYKAESGTPAAYIFNSTENGYMIVSADDVAYPLLGYTDSGSFDANNVAPGMRYWLEEYARQIEWAKSKGRKAPGATIVDPAWTAIAPLCKTKWNQDAPFNDQCPIEKATNLPTYAGCVAVSMAQLMKYFEYPLHGEGIVQYTPAATGQKVTLNLSRKDFAWDNMLNFYSKGYYDEEQADAVAYLLKCCGYSVSMNYGSQASGANGFEIATALKKYFNYDPMTRDERRMVYTASEWAKIIYDNIKNVGPVVMNGQSPVDGGHSFVCDGYNGDGLFHFNWGWGGMSDGYYRLEALNPEAQGIGGMVGGFNFMQNIVIGARPKTADSNQELVGNMLIYGALTGEVKNNQLIFGLTGYRYQGWGSMYDDNAKLMVAARFTPTNGGDFKIIPGVFRSASNGSTVDNITSTMLTYYSPDQVKPYVDMPSLTDGEYVVTLMSKDKNVTSSIWQPVNSICGYPNYLKLTVSNGSYTVTNIPIAQLQVNDVKILTDLYYGKNFKIQVTVTNPSDVELSEGYSPALYNGSKRNFWGGSVQVTAGPGETVNYEWVAKFTAENGVKAPTAATDYTLGLYEPMSNTLIGQYGNVTMNPAPASANLTIGNFVINDCPRESVSINDKNYNTYIVDGKTDITIDVSYNVRAGYFDGQMILSLYQMLPNGSNVLIDDQLFSEMPFIKGGAGVTKDVSCICNVSDLTPGCLYYIYAKYTVGARENEMSRISFYIGQSGVDDIELDSSVGMAKYYNMQGVEIANPQPGQIVIERKGDKSVKRVY